MKAVEFKTKLKNNKIIVPKKFHKQITTPKNKNVRVIVLMEEQAKEQFLKGYSKTDSVYDHS